MGKPEKKSEAKPETEFEQAVRLSLEALAHAERYRSPPLPRAYEVWYNYAAGDDPALRERIDCELVKTNVVDLTKIEEIYREHFLEKRLAKDMTAIGDELHTGVRHAVAVLREGLGENERFVGSLRAARDLARLAQGRGAARDGRAPRARPRPCQPVRDPERRTRQGPRPGARAAGGDAESPRHGLSRPPDADLEPPSHGGGAGTRRPPGARASP